MEPAQPSHSRKFNKSINPKRNNLAVLILIGEPMKAYNTLKRRRKKRKRKIQIVIARSVGHTKKR